MNWILALALTSSADGYYIKTYPTEKACVQEMKQMIKKMDKKSLQDIEKLACIPESMALFEGEFE